MRVEAASIPIVSRETHERLQLYVSIVREENKHQNLVSRGTLDDFWVRHIDDSLQLLALLAGNVIADVGSGAGIPGLVLACASPAEFHLIEPRRRRADFLTSAIGRLGLSQQVSVHPYRVETITSVAPTTIVARAVAPSADLFKGASRIMSPQTRWVLPKGRTAVADLERARETWQGRFRLVRSVTDPAAAIIVADGVERRR